MNVETLFSLKQKVMVVTGASKGIGKSLSILLAKQGAHVVLIGRNEKELTDVQEEIQRITNGRQKVMSLSIDLTKIEEIPHAVNNIIQEMGTIDVLINNAGVNIPKKAEDVTVEDWDAVLDINLKSVFFLSRTVGTHMKEQKKGKIINMSSQMAFVGYYLRSAYCASKGGLTQLTKALAIEWAKDNVLVNAIAPTFIETPFTERMFQDEVFKKDVLSRIPVGRLAKEEDLFGAVVYLASDASNMVTGQTIVVDGGWTVW
ncbi:SDR family NAD(P)-dependent oxidoreductase [Priestia abyssalis]|uniref:SDR family NAD(P)-dependent oxidoreductase n=1 Tax=Priestia abyssalis TaxID=1221450 RepID=UPI000995BC09|nr:glucose 1-dehydrogenase [Priestia abyssalis]